MKIPTISEIKANTKETKPFFFNRKILKHFGQTMRDFKVIKFYDGYFICAPARDDSGTKTGYTVRLYTTLYDDKYTLMFPSYDTANDIIKIYQNKYEV